MKAVYLTCYRLIVVIRDMSDIYRYSNHSILPSQPLYTQLRWRWLLRTGWIIRSEIHHLSGTWKSLLCMQNHNFCRNICKSCSAPQMRQDLDQYSHRNGTTIKQKKGDFQIPGFVISSLKNTHWYWTASSSDQQKVNGLIAFSLRLLDKLQWLPSR